MSKKIAIIGSGFAGLAAATTLADLGYEVHVYEKNEMAGGRARQFQAQGFTYDMGPSWYWMPEVFDAYFERFGVKRSDFYELIRLDPSYRIYYGKEDVMDVPAHMNDLEALFESYEKGSAIKLRKFLAEAAYKYEVGMAEFVWKPGHSIMEFADMRVMSSLFKLQMFSSVAKQINGLFKHPNLVRMLEFPVLFLGATPQKTPALYSLMNYADLALGTWYPMGGMYKVIDGMVALAEAKGVTIHVNQAIEKIVTKNGKATGLLTENGIIQADVVVGAADYHHVEQHLLEEKDRQYTETYWDKRTMAPSSLLFYLGVNKKLNKLKHHNLFFDEDFEKHAYEIYEKPQWPSKPLFYVCVPSISDPSVAPEGQENVFLLMPVAPGLEDNEGLREKYYDIIMDRLEDITGQEIRSHVTFKKSYAHSNFEADYNAYKGNAYGLANTLLQTAFLKPKMRSTKIENLLYAGQLTTPGPGVPPSLISGQVVASEIARLYPLDIKSSSTKSKPHVGTV